MKLFNRKNNNAAAIPEDLQPYYTSQPSGLRRWLGPILRIALLVLILALLVFGTIWLVRHFGRSDAGKKTTAQTSSQNISDPAAKKAEDKKAAENKTGSEQGKTGTSSTSTDKPPTNTTPAPTTGTTGTSGTATTPAVGSTPPTPSASTTTPTTGEAGAETLANTGPGETLAMFVLVTVAAAFVHRLYTLRKLS